MARRACAAKVLARFGLHMRHEHPLHSCADFWRPDGLPGKECSPCPDGGICDGQLNLPYPDNSFWGASSLNAANESVLAVYDSTQEGPYFFACQTCTGNFTCQQGYTGTLCMSCVPGQFSWRGSCSTACADIEPQGPVSVLTILAVVAMWIVSSCPSCIDFGSPAVVLATGNGPGVYVR